MLFDQNLPQIDGEVDRFQIEFEFAITGKQRPRFDGRCGRVYMPAAYANNKNEIRWMVRVAMMESKVYDFLSSKHFYAQRTIAYRKVRKPKSKSDKEWLSVHRPLNGHARGSSHSADLDNFIGTLMDACQGLLYPNDSGLVISLEERVWTDRWGAFYEVVKIKDPEHGQIK